MSVDKAAVEQFINKKWDDECIPVIEEYIKIECQSPSYDKEWETNGLLDKAFDLLLDWSKKQQITGLTVQKFSEKGKTPFALLEIPATNHKENTILMYGHMDKQPPLLPWAEGLGPYTPVIRDGKLYGRGGADDGYAIFTALTSIEALQRSNVEHGRIVVIIEACEESGSPDLPFWIGKVKDLIKVPDLIICLDSGALNYEQLWLTNSLRGVMNVTLKIEVLKEGVHSGIGGGLVADSFRIARMLLSRLEDEQTGEILLPELHCKIPEQVVSQMQTINELGSDAMTRDLPLKEGCKGYNGTSADLALSNSWKPCITVTGQEGLPPLDKAGNVLRTGTTFMLSIRLPPLVQPDAAFDAIKKVVEKDPPYGAHVTCNKVIGGRGWAAPLMEDWLVEAVNSSSEKFFGKKFACTGLGGSIPFMAMLGDLFPKAQFVITGILGPLSNAHGPNEFLHIDFTKKLTCAVSGIVAAHAAKKQ